MSYKSEMSTSDWFSACLVIIDVDSALDDSASRAPPVVLFGISNGPTGAHAPRVSVKISHRKRNSDAHIARSYKPGIRLPGAQWRSFSRSSRGYKSGFPSVAYQFRAEWIRKPSLNPESCSIRVRVDWADPGVAARA